jgi:hypothetical protein
MKADPERALPDDVTEANDRREMVGNRDSRRDGTLKQAAEYSFDAGGNHE